MQGSTCLKHLVGSEAIRPCSLQRASVHFAVPISKVLFSECFLCD